ncbi:MAG: hypothetical protein M3P34_01685, partial [Actinomycetota bacterium]|nr:hypothetical protein [Actinomycetota bacterium]
MSGEQALERSVLERKERDELQTIAEALGVKPGARTKKADLIAHILVAAGVEPQPAPANGAEGRGSRSERGTQPADPPVSEERPRRTRTPRAKATDAAKAGDGATEAATPESVVGVSASSELRPVEADADPGSTSAEGGADIETEAAAYPAEPTGANGKRQESEGYDVATASEQLRADALPTTVADEASPVPPVPPAARPEG